MFDEKVGHGVMPGGFFVGTAGNDFKDLIGGGEWIA